MMTFIGIIFGMFGIGIMQLVLATAMPVIVTEIGGDYLYSWVFSSITAQGCECKNRVI